MKKLPQHLEESLADYLDGTLAPVQRKAFELQLQHDAALQRRLEELLAAERLLRQSVADQPSKNFTATVMSRLDQYPVRPGLSIRHGIMLLVGILVVTATAVVLLSAGVFNDSATFDLNNLSVAQRYIRQTLPSIPVDGKLVVNAIVLLNLALAFVVLDRAILRPLFQRRMGAS
jgi:anti-sigma factor RsiW